MHNIVTQSDTINTPCFENHAVINRNPDDYHEQVFNLSSLLSAWQGSPFSYDYLTNDGNIKDESDMADEALHKFLNARDKLQKGEAVTKPVIGIGMMDGIEIGIGAEVLIAAHNAGLSEVPVFMRKKQHDDILKTLN